MHHLVAVDAGNTSVKLVRISKSERSAFVDGALTYQQTGSTDWFQGDWLQCLRDHSLSLPVDQQAGFKASGMPARLQEFRANLNGPTCWSVVSVNGPVSSAMLKWLSTEHPQDTVHLIGESDVPLKSNVHSRAQLGRDRLLASWWASELSRSPQPQPNIVVDAGTAVTIDLVTVVETEPCFAGGLIFPGTWTSLRALNLNTADLPDLSETAKPQKTDAFVGTCTQSAIRLGVARSQLHGIAGCVREIAEKCDGQPQVWLTGGGLAQLSPAEQAAAFPAAIYVADLTLLAAVMLDHHRSREQ